MVFVLIADQQLDAEDSDIVILGRAGDEALASIGGKAANLGELVRAGFRVPCGFTVTTRAYAEAAHAAKIEPLVDALARTPINDKPRLASLAAEIRFAIASTPLNGRLARAIVDAYHALGDGLAVAVRSSATAEDLAAASSAGQQDTFLNVRGGDALLDAVRECWASLWTERAVIYRATASIDQRQVRLAVIAQKMISCRGGRRAVHRQSIDGTAPAGGYRSEPRAWRGAMEGRFDENMGSVAHSAAGGGRRAGRRGPA